MRTKTKRFIKIDENNNIDEEVTTDISLEHPWIDVSDIPTLGGHSADIRYYDDVNHEIKLKTKIEFRIGTTRFTADGKDKVCLCVRGENLNPADEIQITINGKPDMLAYGDDLNLTATQPGTIVVKITDHKYYANPNEYTIIAEAPENQDEVSNG